VGQTLPSDADDVDLGFCGERAGRVQHRGRAALQRRVKGERVEQAFQACMKEAPRRAGFSRRGTSNGKSGDSRPFDKVRTGPQLSTGPGSSLRHKVPEGRMKIARQFTGGNAPHQTPTASRKGRPRARPTPHTRPQRRLPPFENRERWGSRCLSGISDSEGKGAPAPEVVPTKR
jgi:hypothetical protein